MQNQQHSIYQDQRSRFVVDKVLNGFKTLDNSKIIFSSIYNLGSDNKHYLINKVPGKTPHFPLDWDLYLLLKAYARVMVTSGQVLRQEIGYKFFHSYDVFDREPLLKYFKERNPDNQKVFILSNSIKESDVENYVKSQYYWPILVEQPNQSITAYKSIPRSGHLNQYFSTLLSKFNGPILLESGTHNFLNYLTSGQENMIDLAIVVEYTGDLPEEVKGNEARVDFNEYFDLSFTSETFECGEGSLRFKIFTGKTK